jgi:hypothetical protein
MKCVKIEMRKIIDSFPAVKSLKVDPIMRPLLRVALVSDDEPDDAVAPIRPVV